MSELLRVLQVEDNPADADLAEALLRAEGFEFLASRVDSQQAFQDALGAGPFDLILSDFSLPSFDGLQALAIARSRAPDVPFIFVSGTLGEERAIEALQQGATDYVLKDRMSRLVPAVRRALRERADKGARHEAELALSNERELLRAVLDSIDAGVAACDAAGTLTLSNRTLRDWLGFSGEPAEPGRWPELAGLRREDGRTPLGREDVPLLRALRGERFQATELVVVSPGRPSRTLLVSGEPMLDAAGNRIGAVIAAHDITERKRADDELQRQREALHQSEKLGALSSLVAGVAHELNNPLSVVLGQATLMHRAASGGPLAVRTEKIAHAAERCGRIVRNFLALARHQPRERQRVLLNRVVTETLEIVGYALKVDGVDVALSLDASVPPLWADPHQLQQVLLNLLGNAQHALRSMPTRRVSIATAFDAESNQARMTVRDSGPGIPTELQRRIFEPFFTTKPEGEGTGLGLSLCQGIVGEHGGAIRVESEAGQGACFVVELPVTAAGRGEAAAAAATPAVESRAILVVDDEPLVRELLQELLVTEGHRVEVATTGRGALDMIRRGGFDVVFADLKMPDMDGRALYEEVERIDPSLSRRFVLMTGDTLGPESRGFLEMSGVTTVAKPFDLPGIAHTIRRLFARPIP